MKIKWTKFSDGWLATRSDGASGYAGWAEAYRSIPAGWTASISQPAGSRGWEWSGGGRLTTLAEAKKLVARLLRQ
jgi:hypothetical protein